jgi:SAM-dependent methyltransferase
MMGREIDLLVSYPRTSRNVEERGNAKTEEDRRIARQFGRDFFDGDRRHGYGGFRYLPRFWQPVIPAFVRHFGLNAGSSLLDVGCGKGFMLYDLALLVPGLTVKGMDISDYAIENTIEAMKANVQVADAKDLPFPDKSFDVVIAINTIHNLEQEECGQALREIERVARTGSFITVDAYRTEQERVRMLAWNLTAKTILSVDEWKAFFADVGYRGDYYWFIP